MNGKILWANLHLLFWLSLVPFTTAWIGGHYDAKLPVIAYGLVLLFSAIAYFVLQAEIIKSHGDEFPLRKVVGSDKKGKISMICYTLGVGVAFLNTWISLAFYIFVAILWLMPDRRIEESV